MEDRLTKVSNYQHLKHRAYEDRLVIGRKYCTCSFPTAFLVAVRTTVPYVVYVHSPTMWRFHFPPWDDSVDYTRNKDPCVLGQFGLLPSLQ